MNDVNDSVLYKLELFLQEITGTNLFNKNHNQQEDIHNSKKQKKNHS